jgi:hypothetical protein
VKFASHLQASPGDSQPPGGVLFYPPQERYVYEGKIPLFTLGGLVRYVERGIQTGSFLQYMLSNDVLNAVKYADTENREHIVDIILFMHQALPYEAFGSPEKYTAWINKVRDEIEETVEV